MAHPPGDGKGHHKKHADHPKHEEHSSVDAPFWFISWADLVTLLFGLFVALFSISNLSEVKLKSFLEGIKGDWGKGEGISALEALKKGKTQMVSQSRRPYFKGTKNAGPPWEGLIAGKDRACQGPAPGSKLVGRAD